MKKYLFVFILITFIQLCNSENIIGQNSQSAEMKTRKYISFDYRILAKDTLQYSQFSDLRNFTITTLQKDETKYNLYLLQVDEKNSIYMYNYTPQKPDYNSPTPFASHDRDCIQIGNKKFVFDEITYGNGYLKEEPRTMTMVNAYFFSFETRKYFVAFFVPMVNSNYPNHLICLFDITINDSPKLILSEYQASSSIHCLGDFNQNGILDFACVESFGNRLSCKTLEGNQFKEIKDYYLIIVDSPNKPKILLEKSKWFFDLEKR